jgi:tetratricopeptide (TPR) repeat protein
MHREFQSPWKVERATWIPVALLSLVIWVAFGHVIRNGLVFDDLDAIKNNDTIVSLKNLPILFSKDYFERSDEFSYRPIVTLSYFGDCAIAGKNPAVYHIHNLALHHANVLLAFVLFNLLGAGRWRSFAIALIVALHPLHTEAIIFPGFREDLQMTLGMLAMSCCLAADRAQLKGPWILIAPATLAYALFAKEGALLLPAAWLAADAIHNLTAPRRLDLKRRYVLLVLVLIFYVAIRFFVMANPAAAEMDVVEYTPLKQRLLTAPHLFAYYVRRFFWPVPLSIIHEIEPLKEIGPAFYSSLIVVGAVFGLWIALAGLQTLASARRLGSSDASQSKIENLKSKIENGWLWLPGLWMIATFAPVSNVYPIVNLWAERFYYAVGVGMAAVVVAGVGALWDAASKHLGRDRRHALAILGAIAGVFLVWAAAIYDLQRIFECRSSLSLWRATVRCTPNNGTALATLAVAELEAGHTADAEQIARDAEQHGGGVYRINFILGQAALRQQNWKKAIEHFEKALTVPPPSVVNRTSLVLSLTQAYRKTGQSDKAAALLRQAVEWDPKNRSLPDQLRKLETKPNAGGTTAPLATRNP